jgi:hypothetical protein
MKGDLVIVRSYGGEPKLVRVWEISKKAIFVCGEENYLNLIVGKPGLWPVGFPKEDVFRYNPTQENLLKNWRNAPTLWEHLVSYV